jgi:protein TonB
MKRFTFLIAVLFLFFGSTISLFGQTQNEEEEEIFINIETPAVFEGGMDNFYEIVNNQMRFSYRMKEGRVFIEFIVDTTGKMTDLKVVNSLSEESDKEALRIVTLISENYIWKPAEQRGKKVKVRMRVPIILKREKN